MPTTGPLQLLLFVAIERQDVEQLVAVDHGAAVFIDHHHAVAVAVQRDTDVGLHGRNGLLDQASSVDPQPALMLRPFGEQPSGITSAPSSLKGARPDFVAAPLAPSNTTLRPSSVRPAGNESTHKIPGNAAVPCRCAWRARVCRNPA